MGFNSAFKGLKHCGYYQCHKRKLAETVIYADSAFTNVIWLSQLTVPCIFYIRMSLHRNIIPNYTQQDATFLDLFIFTDTLHVSGASSAHHQGYITVHTVSGIVNQYCC